MTNMTMWQRHKAGLLPSPPPADLDIHALWWFAQGAAVSASDISSSMANEAKRRYEAAVSSGQQAPATAPAFSATDLESISGSFHTVVCLDVMIHYPQVPTHANCCQHQLSLCFHGFPAMSVVYACSACMWYVQGRLVD